jgi:thiol-disulfide isomerase/thioredoxin
MSSPRSSRFPQRSIGVGLFCVVLGAALMFSTAAARGQAEEAPDGAVQAPQPDPTALATAPLPKSPIAEVDEPRFDYGKVWVNDELVHAFKLRNAGDAPLRITRVKPGCGCTVAGTYPNELAPGETGEFPFKLNTKKMNGRFTKSIAVTTNDPKNQNIQLLLAGEVQQYISMQPGIVQFGRVKADTVATQKVTFTNNTDEPLQLTLDPEQDFECFSARLEEIAPGKQFELVVTAQPPYQTDINRVTLPIKTNVPKQDIVEVTCIATLPKRIEFRPPIVQLTGPARTESVRKINITNNADEPVQIVRAASTDDRLKVDVSEIQAGRTYQVSVTIPTNYAFATAQPDTAILVYTDDEKDNELRIPVVSRQAPRPERPQPPAMTMLGKPAPAAQTATFDGRELQIGNNGDKVQFLAFYASWCGFCKKAMPKIEELYQQYSDNPNVEFVAINLDERTGRRARTEAETLDLYKQWGMNLPMVFDSDKEIAGPYKVNSFPTMFVLGKGGEIEAVHVGAAVGFENTVAKEIDTLLEGKSLGKAASTTVGQTTTRIPLELKPVAVRPSAASAEDDDASNGADEAAANDESLDGPG